MSASRRDLLRLRLPAPPLPARRQVVVQSGRTPAAPGCSAETGHTEAPPPWAKPATSEPTRD